jgi:hypothetical protein
MIWWSVRLPGKDCEALTKENVAHTCQNPAGQCAPCPATPRHGLKTAVVKGMDAADQESHHLLLGLVLNLGKG